MSTKQNVGDDIIQGLTEALSFARGEKTEARVHIPDDINVRAIRKKMEMTQSVFCETFGFTLGAVREWEQGRRCPDRAARVLLMVINKEPEAVVRAIHQ